MTFSPRPNRRTLLKTSAALALTSCLPKSVFAAEHTEVIIIGAGLSGLYAAMLLEESGAKVTVLDAAGHVGGRVRTQRVGGELQEMGASDIGRMYARVIDMIDRLGLSRIPSDIKVRPPSYYVRGQMIHADEWETSDANLTVGEERAIAPSLLENHFIFKNNPFTELDEWLKEDYADLDISLGHYLKSKGVSDEALRLINVPANCSDIWQTSALAMLRDKTRLSFSGFQDTSKEQYGGNDPLIGQVKGGNQRLPEAMANALQSEVHFHKAAAIVRQDATGVEVTCLDGSTYRGAFLVAAVPFHALQRVSFEPGLPALKTAAINELGVSPNTKLYLRPTAKFWEQDGYQPTMWTDSLVERVFAVEDQSGEVGTLLVWMNGHGGKRIDQLPHKDAEALVLDTLANIRPASKGKLELMHHQAWGRNPFIGGCAHNYAPGQVTRFGNDMEKPSGRIHFAGEHTRRLEFGMESAMASAERVLGEIMDA